MTTVEDAVTVEPVGEFALKGIRRPLAAYNVLADLDQIADYGAGAQILPPSGGDFRCL